MLTKETLELLQKQREQKFAFKGADKLQLAKELIANIGEPNGEVRDGLIYPSLAHLLHDKNFDEDQLTEFLNQLTDDNHLFYKIEQNPLNSVLVRSFSSLQIAILLYVHKRDNIIKEDIIKTTLQTFINYFKKEKHYEGYNEEVGWLHSIAHSADVFDQFLTIETIKENEIKEIFEEILIKMKQRHYYYSHDEDERMVTGMTKAIKRDILSNEYLLDYVDRFSKYEKNNNYPEMYYITKNTRNVLRALYFSLIKEDNYDYLTDKILQVLQKNVTLR